MSEEAKSSQQPKQEQPKPEPAKPEEQILIALKGKSGSGDWKLLALTEDEIMQQIKQLGKLNSKIMSYCLDLGDQYACDESVQNQISLALFQALSISSYTVLRSKLELDLQGR